jgi:hypothetical protein
MKLTRRELILVGTAGLLAVPVTCAVVLIDSAAHAERRPRPTTVDTNRYEPQQVVSAFSAIVNPHHVAAKEANEQLRPNELVLGVEINGEARAYPINMLTGPSREIFNDKLGGQSIAATW